MVELDPDSFLPSTSSASLCGDEHYSGCIKGKTKELFEGVTEGDIMGVIKGAIKVLLTWY